jgi:hypothetical protein
MLRSGAHAETAAASAARSRGHAFALSFMKPGPGRCRV